MPYTGPSVSLHVKYTVDPSNVSAFLAALKPAYDAVVAEPENIFFEVYTSINEPGVIKFVENWNASIEWLMTVQIPKNYYKPYLAAIEGLQIKPREHELFQRMPGNEWTSVSSGMTE